MTVYPDNETMKFLIKGRQSLCVAKFLYTPKNEVENIDYVIIKRDDKINDEIIKLWKKLNIGISLKKESYIDGSFYSFIPMGEKTNMHTIDEFIIMKLKSHLNKIKVNNKFLLDKINKYEKLKQDGVKLSASQEKKFEKLKKRYYEVRVPYLKEEVEKLKHCEEILKNKKELKNNNSAK